MKTFEVTLPDEDAALVEKMLQDGPWESIDELFLNGLGTLQEDVAADENLDLDELKAKLKEADASCERGEAIEEEKVWQFIEERLVNRATATAS